MRGRISAYVPLRTPILRLMNTPEEAFSEALAYATVCIIGHVFIYGYNIVSAARSGMNALINGSGNYIVNFATAICDGIILRIGLALLFGLGFKMQHYGFWLGDALAGFTPLWIGLIFYFSGKWKSNAYAG